MSQHASSGARGVLVTIVGVFTLVEGIAIVLGAAVIAAMGAGVVSLAGFALKGADAGFEGPAGNLAGNFAGMALGMFLCVAGVVFVIGLIPLTGGISVIKRHGRIRATLWAILGVLFSGLALFAAFNSARGNPVQAGLNLYYLDGGWLAFELFKLVVLVSAGSEFNPAPMSAQAQRPRPDASTDPAWPEPRSIAAETPAPSGSGLKVLVVLLALGMVVSSALAVGLAGGWIKPLGTGGKAAYKDRLTRMKAAVEDGQGSTALDVLKEGTTVHDRDEDGDTPLHWAAARGRTALVREFLLRGADPLEKNVKGETPLGLAEDKGFDAAAILLRDPDAVKRSRAAELRLADPSEYGQRVSKLRAAIDLGQVSAVEGLLKEGANVNDRDELGETPLMWAAEKGSVHMCLLLLGKGANPADRDHMGGTTLMRAATGEHVQIMAILMTPEDEAKRDAAAFKQAGLDKPSWRALTARDINVADSRGRTAVTHAARTGRLELLRLLVPHSDKIRNVMSNKMPEGDAAEWFNSVAWRLAVSKDAKLRDGQLAVELAKLAVARNKDSAAYIDTLAATYAEAGDFTEAVRHQEQALAIGGNAYAARLELFKKKTPYRE